MPSTRTETTLAWDKLCCKVPMALSLVLMIVNRERQIQFQMQIQIVSTLLIRTGTNQAKQNHPMAFSVWVRTHVHQGLFAKDQGFLSSSP